MRGVSRITYLWPGLSRLWHHGDLAALATAICFAVLLNLVLLSSFFGSRGVMSTWSGYGWALIVAFWAFGVWQTARNHTSESDLPPTQNPQDLFIRAQAEYLRGHWVEAQSLLEQLIRRHPRDVESHLLLSSVFRRSHRIDLSRRQLRRLQELEHAARWRFEVQREFGAARPGVRNGCVSRKTATIPTLRQGQGGTKSLLSKGYPQFRGTVE